MAKKQSRRVDVSSKQGGSLGSLGDLLKIEGFEPGEGADEPSPSEHSKEHPADLKPQKITSEVNVRKEKKGRRGKIVTIVDGMNLCAQELEEMAKKMRKSLGCGGGVEEGRIVLQGDIGDRVRLWLKDNL